MKRIKILIAVLVGLMGTACIAQDEVAVIGVRSIGPKANEALCTSLIRIELGKTDRYKVLDDDDITYQLNSLNISSSDCYGIECMTQAGQHLAVDKVISGRFEAIGDKIIISIRMIDVATGQEELSSIGEFVKVEDRIQDMVGIVINDMLEIENDKYLVETLVYYETANSMPQTTLNLSGPRMGGLYVFGDAASRLTASEYHGGFDMSPFMSQFGYQFETQYLSSGNFSALVEFIPMISGLEQGVFRPSFSLLNGFRMNQQGWELAFGPSVTITQTAKGFNHPETGEWTLTEEWGYTNMAGDTLEIPEYLIERKIDSRGDLKLATTWVWTIGKTFRSGYLNIPVNIFVSTMKKHGTMVGFSVGFNIRKSEQTTL